MRKSTLFLSAALTTFMLAVLFGVVSAYQNMVSSTVDLPPTVPTEMVSVATDIPPTQVMNLSPEAAADVAAKVLGRTDLYSVEVTQFEGADVYLVTFSSGDLVYLSLDGRVRSISKLPVTVITQAGVVSGGGGGNGGGNDDVNNGGNGGGGGGNSSSAEQEDHTEQENHDEHEDGDDDD